MELIIELALEIYEFGRSRRFWVSACVTVPLGVSLLLSSSDVVGVRAAAVAVMGGTLAGAVLVCAWRFRAVTWQTWLAIGGVAVAWPLALSGVQSDRGILVLASMWPALAAIPWSREVIHEARSLRADRRRSGA